MLRGAHREEFYYFYVINWDLWQLPVALLTETEDKLVSAETKYVNEEENYVMLKSHVNGINNVDKGGGEGEREY